MKKLLIPALLMFLSTALYSQAYDSSIGVRFGYPLALSYKKFVNETAAVEGIVGFSSFNSSVNYINIRGAYLLHKDIETVDNLQWYYGGGAGIFLWSYKDSFIGEQDGSFGIGLSGYIGLEYTFENTPIAVTVDWAPTIILGGFGSGFGAGYGALGARYILGR